MVLTILKNHVFYRVHLKIALYTYIYHEYLLLFNKNFLIWKTGQPNSIGSIILTFIISSLFYNVISSVNNTVLIPRKNIF